VTETLHASESNRIAWNVEQFRCTGFPTPTFKAAAPSLFQVLTGTEPAKLTIDNVRNVATAEGNYHNVKLVVATAPNRVDVLFTAPGVAPTPNFRVLGTFEDAVPMVKELMERWFSTAPSLQRFAFAAVLLKDVVDRIDGYKKLQQFLPNLKLDPENSLGLVYRINRPRLVRIDSLNLTINRVSRWTVARKWFQQVVPPTSAESAPPTWACRLELDINTAVEHVDEFSRDSLSQLFGKLLDFGIEIAERGDIP